MVFAFYPKKVSKLIREYSEAAEDFDFDISIARNITLEQVGQRLAELNHRLDQYETEDYLTTFDQIADLKDIIYLIYFWETVEDHLVEIQTPVGEPILFEPISVLDAMRQIEIHTIPMTVPEIINFIAGRDEQRFINERNRIHDILLGFEEGAMLNSVDEINTIQRLTMRALVLNQVVQYFNDQVSDYVSSSTDFSSEPPSPRENPPE